MSKIVVATPAEIVPATSKRPPQESVDRATAYGVRAFSPNTHRTYEANWRVFRVWCARHGLEALPAIPPTVAAYLGDLAGGVVPAKLADIERVGWDAAPKLARRPASVAGHVTAIYHFHTINDLVSPTRTKAIELVVDGIRNTHGTVKTKKAPILSEMLAAIVAGASVRDRALVLLGFAGAFRRSELVIEIELADIEEKPEGLLIHLRHSKGDQAGKGVYVRIPRGNRGTCPVEAVLALRKTLSDQSVTEGPLFRSASRNSSRGKPLSTNAVATIVKQLVETAGFNPTEFAGHSMRAGFVTSAARAGRGFPGIMEQTRHKKSDTVLEYIRTEGSWANHVGKGLL